MLGKQNPDRLVHGAVRACMPFCILRLCELNQIQSDGFVHSSACGSVNYRNENLGSGADNCPVQMASMVLSHQWVADYHVKMEIGIFSLLRYAA